MMQTPKSLMYMIWSWLEWLELVIGFKRVQDTHGIQKLQYQSREAKTIGGCVKNYFEELFSIIWS